MEGLKKTLKWLIPLLVGALLFYWVYRKADFQAMADILREGLRWGWVGVFAFFFLLPMILRGLRWKQLLDRPCPGSRPLSVILAVCIAYGANLIFPRIGEVARCGVLTRYDGLSFTKTVGTVVTERIFDMFCLVLMVLAALLCQMPVFRTFFSEHPESAQNLIDTLTSWKLWVGTVLVLAALVGLVLVLLRSKWGDRFRSGMSKVWEGMKSVRYLRHPWLFLLYTLLIWFCYFAGFYVGQYLFHVPIGLSFTAIFTAHCMGSLGEVAPVQGGIGAWHFMVIYTLVFYGGDASMASTFALVVHGLNMLLTIVGGLVAYGWMSLRGVKVSE